MADERNPPLIHREGGPAPRPQEAPPEPAHDDEYRWHTGEHRPTGVEDGGRVRRRAQGVRPQQDPPRA